MSDDFGRRINFRVVEYWLLTNFLRKMKNKKNGYNGIVMIGDNYRLSRPIKVKPHREQMFGTTGCRGRTTGTLPVPRRGKEVNSSYGHYGTINGAIVVGIILRISVGGNNC